MRLRLSGREPWLARAAVCGLQGGAGGVLQGRPDGAAEAIVYGIRRGNATRAPDEPGPRPPAPPAPGALDHCHRAAVYTGGGRRVGPIGPELAPRRQAPSEGRAVAGAGGM